MKISLIADKNQTPKLFTEREMKRLSSLGEFVINETTNDDFETISKLISNSDITITSWGSPSINKDYLKLCPNLKLIAHAAGSVKPVVSDELWEQKIRVFGSACILGRGVAETALGFTLSGIKDFYNQSTLINSGLWIEKYDEIREMFDMTVGIVGFGFAGSHYAKLLKMFNVQTLVYDPFMDEAKITEQNAKKVSLNELLEKSDIISVHAPSIPETENMFNKKAFDKMKDNSIFINTARGSLVDENALTEALISGKLHYAFIDVTNPEPPVKESPLRKLNNCIMTPHLAGLSNNGKLGIGKYVTDQIESFIANGTLENETTKEMLARMA